MPRWLVALFVAVLVLFTDDYVIAGILPELGGDLGVSQAAAGQLITVFSLTVAVTAPVAAVALASVWVSQVRPGARPVNVATDEQRHGPRSRR